MDPTPAQIEAEFPGWRIGSVWQSAGTGPDARNLTASRNGVLLTALTAAELREKIRHEEARNLQQRPRRGDQDARRGLDPCQEEP